MAEPWPLVAGLLIGLAPRLVFDAKGERRPVVAVVAWALAGAALLLEAFRTSLNDDEVFYLADSWAARSGETSGALPMRYLVLRPFLLPPWPPSATLVAGRIAMAIVALVGAIVAVCLARRQSASAFDARLAGALTLLWLATGAEAALLRPEQLAGAAVLLGIALLVAPPSRWSRGSTVGGAFVLLTLAASISHRRLLLLPAAMAILVWLAPRSRRRADLARAGAGMALGSLPSLLYVATRDSLGAIWYWNWTFVVRESWIPAEGLGVPFPRLLLLLGVAGAAFALRRPRSPGAAGLSAFWAASTALAVLVPFTLNYALGPWLALSLVLAAALASHATPSPASPVSQRLYAVALGLLGVAPLLGAGVVRTVPSTLGSELALVDWLKDAAGGGPVACVAPFHPIKAANAWRLWNAWWYCYLREPAFNRWLNPDLAQMLRSAEARVIEWDPWPQASGHRNVIAYAVANGFLTPEQARAVAVSLRSHYRLVRWARPLPAAHGGGRFLVPRTLALDSRVVVLADQRIAP